MSWIDTELRRIVDGPLKGGHYETIISKIYLNFVDPDSSAIDVGANRGLHTFRLASKISGAGHVLAFEPMEDFARNIQVQIAEKYGEPSNIKIYNLAVSNEPGEVKFYRNNNAIGQSTIVPGHGLAFEDTVQMSANVVRLDDFVHNKKIGRLDFIKCDAEGADFNVLRGAENLMNIHKPLFIVEFQVKQLEKIGVTSDEFFDYLEEQELDMFSVDAVPFTRERYAAGDLPHCYEMIIAKRNSRAHKFVTERVEHLVTEWIKGFHESEAKKA